MKLLMQVFAPVVLGIALGFSITMAAVGLTPPAPTLADALDAVIAQGCEPGMALSPANPAENQGNLIAAGKAYVETFKAQGYDDAELRIFTTTSGEIRGIIFGTRC